MGSFFHYDEKIFNSTETEFDDILSHSGLYLNGRSALLAIIEHEKIKNKFQKIYVPSYYCHSVTKLLEKFITVEFYDCDFKHDFIIESVKENTLVLLVEYFGHQSQCSFKDDMKGKVIVDKTYNPFSNYVYDFEVSYVFGSLRKVFPIYDGGFLYPKLNHNISLQSVDISKIKIAMHMKQKYLHDYSVDKDQYLSLFYEFEESLDNSQHIHTMSIDSQKLIKKINIEMIYQRRKQNLEYVSYALKGVVDIFYNPIYFSMYVDVEQVDLFKKYMIGHSVYPAILWMEYNGDLPIVNGKVLFCFHMDYRYDLYDLDIFIDVVKGFYQGETK